MNYNVKNFKKICRESVFMLNEGKCRICSSKGKLSYEHMPPRGSFNSQKSKIYFGEELLKHVTSKSYYWDISRVRGIELQRGAGGYFLCQKCNNFTGKKYVNSFNIFSKQGMETTVELQKLKGCIKFKFKKIKPFNIFKQVICMFLVSNSPEFVEKNRKLKNFILDPMNKEFPDNISIHCYLNLGQILKKVGLAGIIANGKTRLVSEIVTIPFGFTLEFNSINEEKLFNLNNIFLKFDFDEETDLELEIPIKYSNSPYPLDFRTQNEIKNQRIN